jgi:hypothetical protein
MDEYQSDMRCRDAGALFDIVLLARHQSDTRALEKLEQLTAELTAATPSDNERRWLRQALAAEGPRPKKRWRTPPLNELKPKTP